jgi:mitofusin
MVDVNVTDIFDLQRHISFARAQAHATVIGGGSGTGKEVVPYEVGGLGAASLAVGAFTMSGKMLGVRQLMDGVLRVGDIASHPLTRKWIGPVLGVATVGAVVYVLYELPRSIPRNIGRHIQSTLAVSDGVSDGAGAGAVHSNANGEGWSEMQAQRIGKEVRKVMRLASWDLRERFKSAVDAKNDTVRESEEMERKAARALGFFGELERKVDEIREQVGIKV